MSFSLSLSTLLTARLCLCLSRVFQWHVSVLKPPHLSSQTSTKRRQMDYFTLLQSLCVSLLLFFTFLFSIKWKTINQSSPSKSGRSPPSPKALPIIGHLHLLTDLPHMSLTTLAHQLGPIIHLRLGRVPTLIVFSAHYARLVLKTHDHVFATRPQLLAAQYLSFGCSDVTFSPYGSYWLQARKICVTELLSTKRISSFRTVREEEVNGMLNSVLAQSKSEAVDMSKLFFTLANDVLCRVAFGKRFVEGSGEGKKCHVAEVLAGTQALLAGFSVGDFFPEWKCVNWVCGLKGRLEKNLKDLRRVCDEIISEHMRNDGLINNGSTTKVREEDLVDVLIRVQKRHDLEVPITNDNLKALVLDMFVAGTDTTATTLEWTMTELMRHPRELKKAQQQVREVASNSGKVEESHLHQLPYVKAAVKEAMRLHPPVPLLVPRESMDDCDLDGYQIPAKTRVLINAYAIGRDPDSWEDPLMYKPERFEEDAAGVKDHDFRFLAFGGGRRGCPGYGFALATVEIALARLLYHFDWSLPGDDGPDDVDLDEIFGNCHEKEVCSNSCPYT